jgi:ribosomal protein S18 acetylase RimI-like enzyme
MSQTVEVVTEADLPELLPLVRAYLDFYEVDPPDEAMLALSRALIADPELEGVQFIARADRDPAHPAVGFASLFWTWATTRGGRLGVMNDLYVAPQARGSGAAEALIEACRARCEQRGAVALEWQTAVDNQRAQAVYERVGGERLDRWLDYAIKLQP